MNNGLHITDPAQNSGSIRLDTEVNDKKLTRNSLKLLQKHTSHETLERGTEPQSVAGSLPKYGQSSSPVLNPRMSQKLQKFTSEVGVKLASEWRNIYRLLLSSDSQQKGSVSTSRFNQICSQFNVFLSNEEIRKLALLSQQDDRCAEISIATTVGVSSAPIEVNYFKLSRLLGLHKTSLNLIQSS